MMDVVPLPRQVGNQTDYHTEDMNSRPRQYGVTRMDRNGQCDVANWWRAIQPARCLPSSGREAAPLSSPASDWRWSGQRWPIDSPGSCARRIRKVLAS